MSFHRLAAPGYYIAGGGPLPPGYDYLNDPVGGGSGIGIAVPADSAAKTGGVYDGVYFVGEDAENANAYNFNRPAVALGANSDAFDDLFNRPVLLPNTIVASRTSTGENSLVVTSTHTISDLSMSVVTPTRGPLYVGGVRVRVASTSGARDADGFFTTNVTINYNVTIPVGVVYSVIAPIRNTFKALDGTGEFPLFWFPSLADDLLAGYRYDYDIVTVSDVSTSSLADHNNPDLSSLLDGSSALTNLALRPGAYTVVNGTVWSQGGRAHSTQPGSAAITVTDDGPPGTDVLISSTTGGLALTDISLATVSTGNVHFVAQGDFEFLNIGFTTTVEAGALELNGNDPSSHRLVGLRMINNATLTTASAALKITGYGALDASNLEITEALPTAATPTASLLIDSYLGRAVIRNSKIGNSAVGVDALRINGVSSSTGGIVFERCDIYNTGTGDAWALRVINSTGIVFRHCRFYGERGQAVCIENSGVTFDHCTFEAGTDTSLTNAQLVCGEGYGNGGDQEHALRFIWCQAVYNVANVRATGAPTKPIIELGGRGATAYPGRVDVDGLYVRPDSGSVLSHQYTAVLLHDHNGNESPNGYRNVTIDELGRVPTGAGTLAKFNGGFTASALLVEVVGAASTEKIRVENLKVINAKAPATSLTRGIIGFEKAQVTGMTLDGYGAAAGTYAAPLVHARSTDLDGPHFYTTAAIETTNYTLLAENTSIVRALRYHRRGLAQDVDGPIVGLALHSTMTGGILYIDVSLTTTSRIVSVGIWSKVIGFTLVMNGVLTGGPLIDALSADKILVEGSTFQWSNNAADTIGEFTGCDFSVVTGNQFVSSAATAPVVAHTGTTRIPDGTTFVIADMNVIAASVGIDVPTVY